MEEKIVYFPEDSSTAELIVKRSKFIACAEYCDSPEQARDIIKDKREENPGYTHVVYAFKLGKPGSEICGMSDDGEPSGTAGKPVLAILKGNEIYNIIVTIVRYYGGTKLGTGGLVKAYSDSSKLAIENLKIKKVIETSNINFEIEYSFYDSLKRILSQYESEILEESFTENINLTIQVPTIKLKDLEERLIDLTNNAINISRL